MQTKQKIEMLLASAGVNPNKRLGQHFLIDLNLMKLLVQDAEIKPNDTVLEVGCGTGSLTEEMAEYAGNVICVEFDDVLAGIAQNQLKDKNNVTIFNADILENKTTFFPQAVDAVNESHRSLKGRLLLVANLPYNVSTPVMMNLICGHQLTADAMYVTVQKEVGLRMSASPNTSSYGSLSVMMAAAGNVKLLHKLRPDVFWPKPAVDSVMISFVRQPDKVNQIHDIHLLREVVSLFIGHRRKMLRACVKFAEGKLAKIHHWNDLFTEAFVDPHNRAEQLTVDQFISMANLCSAMLSRE